MNINEMKNSAWRWLINNGDNRYIKEVFSGKINNSLDAEELLMLYMFVEKVSELSYLKSLVLERLKKYQKSNKDIINYLKISYLNTGQSIELEYIDLQNQFIDYNIEENFFKILNSILLINDDGCKISYLNGLLIYLVQNYGLTYSGIVANELIKLENSSLLQNYCEFLSLHQSDKGYVGLLNPLKPSPFKSAILYNRWLTQNTIHQYIFLENFSRY